MCAGQIVVPKDESILILRTCEYVILHAKKDSAGVIKLRNLSRVISLKYPSEHNLIT